MAVLRVCPLLQYASDEDLSACCLSQQAQAKDQTKGRVWLVNALGDFAVCGGLPSRVHVCFLSHGSGFVETWLQKKKGRELNAPLTRGTAKRLAREVTSSRARLGARSTRSRAIENSRFSNETRSRSYAKCFVLFT
jgi:hypothetical protein